MTTTSTKRQKNVYLAEIAVLLGILFIMAFTPLGYLKVGMLSISFLTVPVAIGAIILGPTAGAILGGFFGLTSFLQCFGLDAFGTAIFGINPFFTAILCFIPRILMGLLTGYIFRWVSKVDKTKLISYGVAGLSGALLNTILFLTAFILMFSHTDFFSSLQQTLGANSLVAFIGAFVGFNGVIEAIVCLLVASAAAKALDVYKKKYNF